MFYYVYSPFLYLFAITHTHNRTYTHEQLKINNILYPWEILEDVCFRVRFYCLQVVFDGLSGKIMFDSNGERSDFSVNVLKLKETGLTKVSLSLFRFYHFVFIRGKLICVLLIGCAPFLKPVAIWSFASLFDYTLDLNPKHAQQESSEGSMNRTIK